MKGVTRAEKIKQNRRVKWNKEQHQLKNMDGALDNQGQQ